MSNAGLSRRTRGRRHSLRGMRRSAASLRLQGETSFPLVPPSGLPAGLRLEVCM